MAKPAGNEHEQHQDAAGRRAADRRRTRGRRSAGPRRAWHVRAWLPALAVLALVIVVASGATSGDSGAPGPSASRESARANGPHWGVLELRAGLTVIARISLERYVRQGRLSRRALERAARRALPRSTVVHRGRARLVVRYARDQAAARAAAVPASGGRVEVGERTVAASIDAPVVAQSLRNDCESAALQVLLSTVGVRADQLRIQAQLPRSGPLDPVQREGGRVWGDPALGFVGRADGGGPAGGFGVYQGPIRTVARRDYGRPLRDLSGSSVEAVYQRLLTGHAVLAWVGLAAGPYEHWRSPAGRPIDVNFGEHTIVLTGVRRDGELTVVNPLHGTAETWTRQEFATEWRRLGRRALST